jgi:2-(1,2-epoxy-1,2-dihydrophenyl)acetyl-CoA isomerase
MILEYKPDSASQLLEADDFKAFKLVLNGYPQGHTPALQGVRYIEEQHAFVAQQQVIQAAGSHASAAWREAFAAMVEKAAKYGWVEPGTQAIKVHIQWS